MLKHTITVRVRYGETDRMGFVYYGNYAVYFEVARVEMLRSLGISYRELEDSGVSLPVLEYKIKYIKPAFYDEVLTIETTVEKMPAARIQFKYETRNAAGDLLNIAETTLVFLNSESMKPRLAPDQVLEKMKSFFPEEQH